MNVRPASLFVALMLLPQFLSASACFAQQGSKPIPSLTEQSKDDLLKGFDVDPGYLNRFQPQPQQRSFFNQLKDNFAGGTQPGQSAPQQLAPSQSPSLLNQNKDDLLKGFDVDPSYVGQFQPAARPSTVGMLMKMVGGGIPGIDIDTSGGDGNIKIRAPFVNIDVRAGHPKVKINAPFVKVNTGDDDDGDRHRGKK